MHGKFYGYPPESDSGPQQNSRISRAQNACSGKQRYQSGTDLSAGKHAAAARIAISVDGLLQIAVGS